MKRDMKDPFFLWTAVMGLGWVFGGLLLQLFSTLSSPTAKGFERGVKGM